MDSLANNRLPVKRPIGSCASSHRAPIGFLIVLALLAVAACGSNPAADNPSHQPANATLRDAEPLVAVTYEDHERGSEGSYRAHMELVAAGPKHVRYEVKATGYPAMLFVYDGHRLLVHDPEEFRPWMLYDAPKEHPDVFGVVSDAFSAPGSAEFQKTCRSATVVGHRHILGRSAVGYHCAGHFLADGSSTSAYVAWLDEKTHVLLQSGHLHATVFDEHPDITAATFSTQPPKGVKVEAYAAQKRSGGPLTKAPDFELKRVSKSAEGTSSKGAVSMSDYENHPLVLAFFASDLTFDPDGEDCPRCVDSLLTLQQLTDTGTSPAVLAVQEGEEGKPGLPLIPKGLLLEVVNDPDLEVQHSFGLSEQVGFAFIGSDGMVHQVFDKAPTDQQLKDALDALQ